jgi:c-di-GMP-binding flagellar brake protein YcgR
MDDERFHVHARLEVLQILRAIAQTGSVISMHADRGPTFALSTLLAVDADTGCMYLDAGKDNAVNQRLIASSQVLCVSSQDRVKIQFYADLLEVVEFDQRPAFQAKLPDWLMKLQRRDYFRVATPIANPVMCQFPLSGPDVALALRDIGLGGMCVIGTHTQVNLEVGTVHSSCRLDLPEIGMVTLGIRVQNFHEATLKNGLSNRLTGLQFLKLTGSAQNLIQRYVSKLERDRRLLDAE